MDYIIEGIEKYLLEEVLLTVKDAFRKSQLEVKAIRERTKDGILLAKLNGKQIGRVKGKKYITQKEKDGKKIIFKKAICFGGNMSDKDLMKKCGLSRNTYYKYKKELTQERA